jgi:bifunctional non-homologous end joining protein LigD
MLTRRIRTDGFVDPCAPSLAAQPPSGPDWIHEIKHDGYRLIVRRDGPTVRLSTHRGYDWTDRYPAIAVAAAKLRAKSFTLDGEAVVVGHDGVARFDALHCRHKAHDALYAFIEAWSGGRWPCRRAHALTVTHRAPSILATARSGGATKVVYRVGSVGEPKGFILTTILGIAGAFVATYLSQAVGWYKVGESAGLIGGVVGAIILLFVCGLIAGCQGRVT